MFDKPTEYTYKQKMGYFKEFENICFVDTLDNVSHAGNIASQMAFFDLWDENAERIMRQNERKISVIIGNPPYNANQLNENENNKNREYPFIDKRIKETYVKHSKAQKTKLYDMYVRFLRWASDRIDQNGIIAFITNRSFIDARGFDGFRKVIADDFTTIYVIDLGGDVRKDPRLSGPKNNVFAIQTGVAISFLVKKSTRSLGNSAIYYACRPALELATDKLSFLSSTNLAQIKFQSVEPDSRQDWINKIEANWSSMISLGGAKRQANDDIVLFHNSTLGVSTNRDDWVYDYSSQDLEKKLTFFIDTYNDDLNKYKLAHGTTPLSEFVDRKIKWTPNLETRLRRGLGLTLKPSSVRPALYRPYLEKHLYFDADLITRISSQPSVFPNASNIENLVITFSGIASNKPFSVLAVNKVYSLDLLEKTQGVPFYYYGPNGVRSDNLTNNSLKLFKEHYSNNKLNKLSIFYYIYAVLHSPSYREKYKFNLRHEFPRIPFYDNFKQWASWGKELMDLHLNFESADPYPLTRIEAPAGSRAKVPIPRLKADKLAGTIIIDSDTTLTGVPKEAWDYRLGTYSALEWILESYKEKNPRDPTIRDKFNTYKFADYKETVIDLLMRVCTVSVETMRIISQMPVET